MTQEVFAYGLLLGGPAVGIMAYQVCAIVNIYRRYRRRGYDRKTAFAKANEWE
jgi:hypothetical protein